MYFGNFSEFDKGDFISWIYHDDCEIQKYYGKLGIVHFEHPSERTGDTPPETAPALSWVVPPRYDSIFRYMGVFVLCEGGKVGAVRCVDDAFQWIVPCEYYAVDRIGWGVVSFSKHDETKCYFSRTDTIRTFSKISPYGPDGRYIFAIDVNSYYIIDSYTEDVLWSCAKDDSRLNPYRMFGNEPCLVYMGETDGLPMFFDCMNSNFIVPCRENKLDFMPDFPNVITPIIVQGKNIINIIDDHDKTKVYAGNYEECLLGESEGFDEVTVEIKVTLKSKTHTEERCYPIPNGTFVPGDVVDLWKWYDNTIV